MEKNHKKKFELVITIPTRDIELAKRCFFSFRRSLVLGNGLACIIYNGIRNDVPTETGEHLVIIGSEDGDDIARVFAEVSGTEPELLFGSREYNRSYGGASNLALSIALALDIYRIGKVDDDCLETSATFKDSWIIQMSECFRQDKVTLGSLSGSPTNPIDELPRSTSDHLIRWLYPRRQWASRRKFAQTSNQEVIKNGSILLDSSIIRIAAYPVLWDGKSRTSMRGEIYHWRRELRNCGISFNYQPSISLKHSPLVKKDLNSWLRAMVVGFDTSFVAMSLDERGRLPYINMRKERINNFGAWMRKADWNSGIDADKLYNLLLDTGTDLADRLLEDNEVRQKAWGRLMSNNLSEILAATLPKLFYF